MTPFCETPFWDHGLTVNTSLPGLTPCFQKTVLRLVPFAFMCLTTPFYGYTVYCSKRSHIPHSWLNISKTAVGCMLVVLCLMDLLAEVINFSKGQPIYPADLIAPASSLIAMTVAVGLIQLCRKKGYRVSGVLFCYWLLQFTSALFLFLLMIKSQIEKKDKIGYTAVSISLFLLLVLTELILACLVDKEQIDSQTANDPNACPEEMCSFLSVISFWWFTRIVVLGYKRALERADLWSLNPHDRSNAVAPMFDAEWDKELTKQERSQAQHPSKDYMELKLLNEDDPKGDKYVVNAVDPKKKVYQPSLWFAMGRTFSGLFSFAAFLKLCFDILQFASPILLKVLIRFTRDKTAHQWQGYLYATLMFVVAFVQSTILHQYFHRCYRAGMNIRTSLISAVYRKALKLSNSARRNTTVGEIVNLMSVDAQRLMDICQYLNMIWSAPFQMTVSLYFLWQTLGPSVLAGVAVMVFMIPVNFVIAKKTRLLQMTQMKYKDGRIKLMNEIFNGIKILKLYAWEESFQKRILDIREKELHVLRQAAYLNAASSFTWTCSPFLVSLTTFAVYVLSSEDNILDAEKAFVSLSLFNILRFPLSMLPTLIANFVQASVSVKRLRNFLISEELDVKNVSRVDSLDSAVKINQGTFSWEKTEDRTALRDINVKIEEGSLVAVVGVVGSGKSSLLSAILGEMHKLNGDVNIKGSVAFVAQQAWIQNATLRDNILFGRPLEQKLYDKIIEASALSPDLDMLPGGDATEIGEKGINLSGGQKQRVSLARAVYADADIYLLDDPLSAVDSHVGKHIFEKVLGPNGLLKKKTRVLVTHGIGYLPQVDNIIVLVDGQVSESGTYKELLAQEGDFAEFLKNYITEHEEDEDLDEESLRLRDEILSHFGSQSDLHTKLKRTTSLESDRSLSPKRSRADTLRSMDSAGNSKGSMRSLASKAAEAAAGKEKPLDKKDKEKLIQAETAETGTVKLAVFATYVRAVGYLVSAIICLLYTLNNAAAVYANFWLSDWSNDAMRNASDATAQRDLRLGVYGALGIAQGLAIIGAALAQAHGALRASKNVHKNLVTNCLRLPMEFFDTTPAGRLVNRFAKDVDTMDLIVPTNFRFWFMCTLMVMSTIVVLCYSNPIFLAVTVGMAILYYLIQRFYVATSRQLKRLESVSRSPIYSHFGETIQGASTIRAYGMQERFVTESERRVDENQICYYPGIVSNRWLAVRLEFVGNCIVLFAALFAVIGRNDLSPGIVGLSISYALNITQTLNWMVRMTSELETNIVAVERIKEYTDKPTEADWVIESNRPKPDWPDVGNVSFKNYQTRYREGLELVLKGISCDVKGGERVGIVGRTGAGKSSLTMALFRIIESAGGAIFVDGVNIADIGLHDLRSKLTIIPQDPVLFSGTLQMNLDPFEQYTDAEIWTALEHAHLKDFVVSLPEGLQYECSESGENLSVGQRQLVCLARALLRKTKILILDEATAAVDLHTDDLIQSTIRTEFAGCTVLTIAHRLNTILDYDRILVLEAGQIVEFGNPQVLLTEVKGVFYSMAKDAGLAE